MSKDSLPNLTELELQIMIVIWRHNEEISVEEIQTTLNEQGKPLALPSIRTMLKILQEKEYVERRSEGRKHLYSAKVSEKEGKSGLLNDILDRAFDGSSFNLVASLLGSGMVKKKDVAEVRNLLDKLDEEE